MGTTAFTLDAARMFRAMRIANTNPSWHTLQGVRIEPIDGGGVFMIATNGAIMLIQRDIEGHADHAATLSITAPKFEPITHDDGTIEGAYHWEGAEITVPTIEPGETVAALASWHIGPSGPHVLVERMEDNYPNWRKAIGNPAKWYKSGRKVDQRQNANGGFTTQCIGPLTENRYSFRLHGSLDDLDQMLLTYPDDPDSLGVLMKCEIHSTKCEPNAMLTAVGRGDLVTAETVH